MRRDNIIRIIALILLCALVYYFSFDQGQRAMEIKTAKIEESMAAKDRLIESLALEVRNLKRDLAKAESGSSAGQSDSGGGMEETGADRITVRLHSSRILFDQRLVLACLEIDTAGKKATLQINLIQEDKLLSQEVMLGQGIRFSLQSRPYTMLLDSIHSSFVTVQIIEL